MGAFVGGGFILAAQALDFRRWGKVAARLLLAEMKANGNLARDLVSTHADGGVYPEWGPSPAFFSTLIWQSRAMLMPAFLDSGRIALVTKLYGYIDSLMRARRSDGRYLASTWIPGRVADVANSMKDAVASLENAIEADGQFPWWRKLWSSLRSLLE
jgi:hypothetical protein